MCVYVCEWVSLLVYLCCFMVALRVYGDGFRCFGWVCVRGVRHIQFTGHGVCARVPLSKLFGWRTLPLNLRAQHRSPYDHGAYFSPSSSPRVLWCLLMGHSASQKQYINLLVCTWPGRLSSQVIPHDWPNCQSGQRYPHPRLVSMENRFDLSIFFYHMKNCIHICAKCVGSGIDF